MQDRIIILIALVFVVVQCHLVSSLRSSDSSDAFQRYIRYVEQFDVVRCEYQQEISAVKKEMSQDKNSYSTMEKDFIVIDFKRQMFRSLHHVTTLDDRGQISPQGTLQQENIGTPSLDIIVTDQQDDLNLFSQQKTKTWQEKINGLAIGIAFGYISLETAEYIPDLFLGQSVKTTNEIVSGIECVAFSIENEKRKLTLWLDPQNNYAARQLLLLLKSPSSGQAEDIFYFVESFMKQGKIVFPNKFVIRTTTPAYELVMDHIPANLNIDRKVKIPRQILVNKVEVSKVDHKPKLSNTDFMPSIPIENYTKVYMQDAPQIKYVWLDGKIEPLTDALAEERLRGHGFTPGTSSQWFSLIIGAAGFLMIVISIGIQVWKNLKKNKDDKKDEDK